MMKPRVALVRYTPDYFLPFGRALEAAGLEVFWINAMHSDSQTLTAAGVPADHSLDTTRGFIPEQMPLAECRVRLGALERAVDGPRMHDIILMDRLLRKKPADFALRYLAHLERTVTEFLTSNRISLVTSGRDTALQLLTMMVSRRLGIPWVVPTRARIPQEVYGFCPGHSTDDMIRLRGVTDEDRQWAVNCLDRFRSRSVRPALKKSARGFLDVLKLMPGHARVFRYELGKAGHDRGNDYSRYPIPELMRMYLRRRVNMLTYKLHPPYRSPGDAPFALYALHTQPESSIDVVGAYYSDQVHLVRTIARSLPSTHELYVKIHPTDVDGQGRAFYAALNAIPGVRLIGHQVDSLDLLKRTSLLFALTGTIAYEAGLMGRPVIVFADNYFNALPTVRRCRDAEALPGLIAQQLDAPAPADLDERLLAFLADLRTCCFDGELNRTYGASTAPLTAGDLSTLQQAYTRLVAHLVEPR